MMKKKLSLPHKGVSLVELIIVLAIMVLLISIAAVTTSKFNKIKEARLKEEAFISLEDFIIRTQKYCRENNTEGYIMGRLNENEFYFTRGMEILETYRLPKGYRILQQKYGNENLLKIKSTGRFNLSGYTTIRASDDSTYKIVINFQKNTIRLEEI